MDPAARSRMRRHVSSSSTPSTRMGDAIRSARSVLAGVGGCAWARDPETRIAIAAAPTRDPLVSPLSTRRDYTFARIEVTEVTELTVQHGATKKQRTSIEKRLVFLVRISVALFLCVKPFPSSSPFSLSAHANS